jgi:hypothetical protein
MDSKRLFIKRAKVNHICLDTCVSLGGLLTFALDFLRRWVSPFDLCETFRAYGLLAAPRKVNVGRVISGVEEGYIGIYIYISVCVMNGDEKVEKS